MTTNIDLAIIGAANATGEALLEILEQRDFPVGKLHLLDAGESVGARLPFRERRLAVKSVTEFDFSAIRLVLFAGEDDMLPFARQAATAGCFVVDAGGTLASEGGTPVVAEVNPEALAEAAGGGVVATPSASAVALAVVLKPLHDNAGLRQVDVVSLQAVSAFGKAGIEELASQTAKLLNALPVENKVFSRQIAFNILPRSGALEEEGHTGDEWRLVRELRQLLALPDLGVNPTVTVVPVFFGHCEAVHIETDGELAPEVARELLARVDGIELADDDGGEGMPTPVTDAANSDAIFVGRIRRDVGRANGLNLWLVADNVRRGAAGNCVRIAEILVRDYL